MQTQLGLLTLWTQGDWVTKSVTVLLLLMSLASWMVIFIKTLDLFNHRGLNRQADAFWHSNNVASGLQALGSNAGNPYQKLVQAGLDATHHHQGTQAHLHNTLDASDWITRSLRNSIDESTARLQSGLAILASVGSTAPFVGLFGTVWGIYHALMGISAAGSATIDKVAGPIGEALIMTALGLAVAIPAVLGYNALLRGNKAVISQLNRFAHDLHAYFISGARVAANGSATRAAQNKDV